MRPLIDTVLPKYTKRRELLRALFHSIFRPSFDAYSTWRNEQYGKIVLYQSTVFENNPLISIVVPAFNTPEKYLLPLVQSVIGQTYQNWELILVDASTEKEASARIKNCKNIDDRIVIQGVENKGISANSNAGITIAKGEYIAFIDHDDVLELNALQEAVKVINEYSDVGLIYTDEDKLSEDGSKCLDPHYKPDWSPHLLTHVNYITHFVVAKKDIINQVGGLDPKRDGAQDYDLILKITDLGIRVRHIPIILYHWRIADHSTAADISNKPYVLKAGEESLRDHYRRKKIGVSVKAIEDMPGFYMAKYQPRHRTTIIIAPFANETLVKKYIEVLLESSNIGNYNIIAPYDVSSDGRLTVVNEESSVEYLKQALEESSEYTVIVNDFVIPLHEDWANDLSGLLEDKTVHAVSPIILKSDTSIIDMGLVSYNLAKSYLFSGYRYGDMTLFGNTAWPRDVDELSGRVVIARKKELKDYLKSNSDEYLLLNRFSADKAHDKFNVVWSNTAMVHVKVPLAPYKHSSCLFNQSFYDHKGDMHTFANEQQLLDALLQVENDIREKASNG